MLFQPPSSSRLIRAQGTFTSDEEIRRIVSFIVHQRKPEFEPELLPTKGVSGKKPEERDALYPEAVRIVLETQRGSVSLLQRRLEIGYSRAARLIDMMAEAAIVGDYKGSQAREVLMALEEWEEHEQITNEDRE